MHNLNAFLLCHVVKYALFVRTHTNMCVHNLSVIERARWISREDYWGVNWPPARWLRSQAPTPPYLCPRASCSRRNHIILNRIMDGKWHCWAVLFCWHFFCCIINGSPFMWLIGNNPTQCLLMKYSILGIKSIRRWPYICIAQEQKVLLSFPFENGFPSVERSRMREREWE